MAWDDALIILYTHYPHMKKRPALERNRHHSWANAMSNVLGMRPNVKSQEPLVNGSREIASERAG